MAGRHVKLLLADTHRCATVRREIADGPRQRQQDRRPLRADRLRTTRDADELAVFIEPSHCASAARPNDPKMPPRVAEPLPHGPRRRRHDHSAALWPLLAPQWKDPAKWWKQLCLAEGKKDYDWSHLARRYFPERVEEKCKLDPSLGVAHACFWKYHPAKAYAWELRLQDEIRADFTIDEPDSAAARARFLKAHPSEAAALREKEETTPQTQSRQG